MKRKMQSSHRFQWNHWYNYYFDQSNRLNILLLLVGRFRSVACLWFWYHIFVIFFCFSLFTHNSPIRFLKQCTKFNHWMILSHLRTRECILNFISDIQYSWTEFEHDRNRNVWLIWFSSRQTLALMQSRLGTHTYSTQIISYAILQLSSNVWTRIQNNTHFFLSVLIQSSEQFCWAATLFENERSFLFCTDHVWWYAMLLCVSYVASI